MKYHKCVLALALLLICSIPLSNLFAQAAITVTDIYQRDYDLINRTVIVFNGLPNYSIEPRPANRQIIITAENTQLRPNLPLVQSLVSPVLESIRVTTTPQGHLQIVISTRRQFYLENFRLTAPDRLVFDIYNKEFPETDREKFAFGRFYYTVGQLGKAEEFLREVLLSSPAITDANYYLGKILLNRGELAAAAESFRRVSYNDSEYLQAQMELTKMGLVELEYSQEMEQVFMELRDYFLRAGNLNRQQLMLALASSIYGNPAETEAILSRIDYDDPNVETMINNIREIYINLTETDISPSLVTIISPPPVGRGIDFRSILIFVGILLIATALIVYLITYSVWKKRLERSILSVDKKPEKPRLKKSAKERLAEKIVSEDKISLPTEEPQKSPKQVKTAARSTASTIVKKEKTVPKAKPVKKVKTPVKKVNQAVKKRPEVKRSSPVGKTTKTTSTLKQKKTTKSISSDADSIRTQLVLKLYEDGWNQDAIAKELGMEISDVRVIISVREN
ncbi:MAG: tetratricopeptide repeat protein [Candidatus Cloacimonetes bacterium]|nr:tetratricopeptide repeat protein [Candidatus Cloacimonadota bacterium]